MSYANYQDLLLRIAYEEKASDFIYQSVFRQFFGLMGRLEHYG